MEQDIYLYPGSQSEAHRLGEAALWDASFHANVSCARDIEAVIRVYGDGRSALKPEASQMVLKRWGFKRTNFVLANTIERLGPYKEQLSAENQEWQKKAYVPPDDAHNRYFEVDTALAYLDAFISQVREAYGKLELFGPEHCEPNSYESLDYEGRVLVLSPDTLKESCWTPQNQLWLAHDGFGCSPHAVGRSIRCTCLGRWSADQMEPHRLHRRSERGIPPRLGQRKAGGASRAERRHGRDGNDLTAERRYAAMRSVEMKNRCLLYYGNPVGYRTEQGVVADSMFRREELEDWLARKGLAVRWEDGIYDRLSSGGYQKAADNGPALKSCRIWQLGPSAPAAMRFIGLDRMSGEYGGPDLTRYQAVFDGTVSTNSLDGIWEAFCRRSLGSDGQPLAISDLVELYDDSGSEFYYVDRTAIVPVQLKAPEQESGMTMTL